jgi:hypothetical protein
MNCYKGGRVKIIATDGTELHGTIMSESHPITMVKFDWLPCAVMIYADELQPAQPDDTLIGMIRQSEAHNPVPGSDFCVVCGADVPEGRQMCGRCEKKGESL